MRGVDHVWIDGNYVAWSGVDSDGGGDRDIFLRDLLTATTVNLSQNDVFADERPVIDSGYVAWDMNETPEELDTSLIVSQVVLHDLAAGETTPLTHGNVRMFLEENRNGHVVYYGRPSGADMDVFYYDTASGVTTQISTDDRQDTDGSSDGDWVVWVSHQLGLGKPFLMSYDFTTNTRGPLFPRIIPNDSAPLVRDGKVAFVRREPFDWDVYVMDLDTRLLTQVTDSDDVDNLIYGFEGDTVLYGDFDAAFEGAPLIGDLYVFDTSTMTSRRITDRSLSNAYDFSIKGDLVVWTQQMVTGDPDSAEVFVYNLQSDELQRLTNNSFAESGCKTDGVRVAWCGDTGPEGLASREVFVATLFLNPFPFFRDVLPRHRYYEAIQELRARGLFDGYAVGLDFEFHPDDSLLRAQFAKMLCGAFNLQVSEEASYAPFADLGPDDLTDLYPHEYAAAALAAGITKGTGATTFSPWADITRAQLVTMIVRAAQSRDPGRLTEPPADYVGTIGDFSPVHAPNMRMAEYNGLLAGLVGFGAGWDPWAPATRGEVAQMLWQLIVVRPD